MKFQWISHSSAFARDELIVLHNNSKLYYSITTVKNNIVCGGIYKYTLL